MEENEKIVSIAKEELASLPAASYTGKIILVDTPEAAEKAVEALRKEQILGFDTETKPSFKRGQINKVALLQLSTHTHCYLFRLNRIGLLPSLQEILENEDILKIGLSIHDDFHNLNKLAPINPKGFVDLQPYVKQYKIIDNSLTRIYGILFDHRISKGQRLTNWEAETLTVSQQGYAALDALACIQIYEHLNAGKFIPSDSRHYKDPPLPPQPAN
ncbi:MAG: 3'-5' exonuclease domain-containing protein 2 [Muribaculaceae bacterium]|nr:3'-5' exonuclease domain-containing protein 2 [Muribaculaceae bacterium]